MIWITTVDTLCASQFCWHLIRKRTFPIHHREQIRLSESEILFFFFWDHENWNVSQNMFAKINLAETRLSVTADFTWQERDTVARHMLTVMRKGIKAKESCKNQCSTCSSSSRTALSDRCGGCDRLQTTLCSLSSVRCVPPQLQKWMEIANQRQENLLKRSKGIWQVHHS